MLIYVKKNNIIDTTKLLASMLISAILVLISLDIKPLSAQENKTATDPFSAKKSETVNDNAKNADNKEQKPGQKAGNPTKANKEAGKNNIGQDNTDKGLQKSKEKTISESGKKLKLTINNVIQRIIKENFDLRNARYDILKTDSEYKKYQKKYAYTLNGELSGSYIRNSTTGNDSGFIIGSKVDTYSFSSDISKYLRTGTRISLGLTHDYSKSNIILGGPESFTTTYTTDLALTLQQSLLKNAFGKSDRLTEKNLKLLGKVERSNLINQLSALIVEGLVDYWNLIVAEKNLVTSQIEANNMAELFRIVQRKRRIGLAQQFEVNQYRSLLYSSRNRVKLAEQNLFDARIKLLKNLNLDNDIELESITQLYKRTPVISFNEAYETALKQRIDYKNSLELIKIAKNSLNIAENNGLPDVNLFASVGSNGQNSNTTGSFEEIPTLKYPQMSVGIRASYVLDDEEAKTALRDARFELRQARLKSMQIKKDIKDEIASQVKKVNISYNIYINTKEAERQAMLYYYSFRREIRRGRFNAQASKDALDSYIKSRYETTKSLIDYNIALLQLELSQNKIFQRFELDIEKILSDPEWKKEDRNLSRPLQNEK